MTTYFEDLTVGQTAERKHTVNDEDIIKFSEITGDKNPLHLDDDYASTTMFKGRIAHGMLSAGFISAILGQDLPGEGSIYLSQNLSFRRPVRPNDEVVARVTVVALDPETHRVTLKTQCLVKEKVVIEGEAVVIAPTKPQ